MMPIIHRYMVVYISFRLLGLTPLFTTDCNYPWAAYIQSLQWPYFANPITLFVTYVVMSLDYSYHRVRGMHDRLTTFKPLLAQNYFFCYPSVVYIVLLFFPYCTMLLQE